MKETAKKELVRIKEPLNHVKAETKGAEDILNMAKCYYSDAEHFYKKEMYIECFEAVIIAWAYVDAGLRLNIMTVPKKYREVFTIE
ncbi:MAG: DUF357 domain-containing protein [Candidatus Nanoarchaeia archaeon]|nr:DUF357 domain-containing protein [Candidatus Nanoarchaeia archaeon]